MRCAECGQNLLTTPSGAPCPECGLVTADALREPQALPLARTLAGFAWPLASGLALILGFAALPHPSAAGAGDLILGTSIVLLILVLPANSAYWVMRLVKRLPRREQQTLLLAFVPRSVMAPALGALAGLVVGIGTYLAWILLFR